MRNSAHKTQEQIEEEAASFKPEYNNNTFEMDIQTIDNLGRTSIKFSEPMFDANGGFDLSLINKESIQITLVDKEALNDTEFDVRSTINS